MSVITSTSTVSRLDRRLRSRSVMVQASLEPIRRHQTFSREVLDRLRAFDLYGQSGGTRPALARHTAPQLESNPPRSEWAGRILEFRDYVESLSKSPYGEPLISFSLAQAALKLWWSLYGVCEGDLAVPDVGAGQSGDLIFIWKRNDHYLSVEMASDSQAEFFSRNQRTGEIWGTDLNLNCPKIPRTLVENLSFFLDRH